MRCEAFAERGCTVIVTSRDLSTLGDFKHEAAIKKFALDVTQDEQIQKVVQQVVEQEGRIDILVNNAGVITPGTTFACRQKNKTDSCNFPGALIDQDIGDVQRAFDTNVFGLWRMAKAVIPEMAKRRSGLVVNIGSSVGEVYVHTDDANRT